MQEVRLGSPSVGAPAPASAAMLCGQRGQGVGHGPSTGSSLASPPVPTAAPDSRTCVQKCQAPGCSPCNPVTGSEAGPISTDPCKCREALSTGPRVPVLPPCGKVFLIMWLCTGPQGRQRGSGVAMVLRASDLFHELSKAALTLLDVE